MGRMKSYIREVKFSEVLAPSWSQRFVGRCVVLAGF